MDTESPSLNPRIRVRTAQRLAHLRSMGERWREADRAVERQQDVLLGVTLAWRRWQDADTVG